MKTKDINHNKKLNTSNNGIKYMSLVHSLDVSNFLTLAATTITFYSIFIFSIPKINDFSRSSYFMSYLLQLLVLLNMIFASISIILALHSGDSDAFSFYLACELLNFSWMYSLVVLLLTLFIIFQNFRSEKYKKGVKKDINELIGRFNEINNKK